MENNRIGQVLRDPTLEDPTLTYHEVRLPWQSLFVRPEVAARVMAAVQGIHRTDWVRVETVTGSVVFVRTEHVVFVREWTPAQRESERRFWNALEEERTESLEDDGDVAGGVNPDGTAVAGSSGWSRDDSLLLAAVVGVVAMIAVVAASVTSWAWMARL